MHAYDHPEIVLDKLILFHQYGGGASNKKTTRLVWNGDYFITKKGEYIVEVILYSTTIDARRAMIRERKILDIAGLKHKDTNTIWIHLVGYEALLKYEYTP